MNLNEAWQKKAKEKLLTAGVTGKVKHSQEKNLASVYGLSKGDPFYVFGIGGIGKFTPQEILKEVSSITKSSSSIDKTTEPGYISPQATLEGLIGAAKVIGKTIKNEGFTFLGTGHPGGLLSFYQEVAKFIEKAGGKIITPAAKKAPSSYRIDYIGKVAVLSDGCSILHTHDSAPMEAILEGNPIDLCLGDHGFAGAAINHNLPVIAVMDTNDPAIAVAKNLGKDITIIPMDDNAPSQSYQPALEILEDLFS